MKTPHDDIETASGMLLAHTALITSLMATLKERGLLKQADFDEVFDVALIAAESSTTFSDHSTHVARQFLEHLAGNVSRMKGG